MRIHFQGARLHFIVHKPYDGQADADLDRLVTAVTIVEQLRQLANLIRKHTDIRFEFEAGIDAGEAIATMNAGRNNRQLLFVGVPANEAAKALTGSPGERLATGAAIHSEKIPVAKDREALATHFEKDVADDIAVHPVSAFEIFDAGAAINYESLGKSVARLPEAVSLFGDISGFTSYVSGLESDDEKKMALRHLHALRLEMQAVVGSDFDGDFMQLNQAAPRQLGG